MYPYSTHQNKVIFTIVNSTNKDTTMKLRTLTLCSAFFISFYFSSCSDHSPTNIGSEAIPQDNPTQSVNDINSTIISDAPIFPSSLFDHNLSPETSAKITITEKKGLAKTASISYNLIGYSYFPDLDTGYLVDRWTTGAFKNEQVGSENYFCRKNTGTITLCTDPPIPGNLVKAYNVMVGAKFKTSSTSGDYIIDLLARVSDDGNNFYMAEINNNEMTLWKHTSGGYTKLHSPIYGIEPPPVTLTPDTWYWLMFRCYYDLLVAELLYEDASPQAQYVLYDYGINTTGRTGLRPGTYDSHLMVKQFNAWEIID